MGARARTVAVVTGDLIRSRDYSASQRGRVNVALHRSFASAIHATGEKALTQLDFRVTAGDEFQFILGTPSQALDVILLMRSALSQESIKPMIRFRGSVGIGPTKYRPAKGGESRPYEWDGPAFLLAREGLERIKRTRADRWTTIVTGRSDLNAELDVILGLIDELQRGWTAAQWEAIGWTLRGLTRQDTARRVKVAHQNISKRLSAAGWPSVERALAFARLRLSPHPPKGANPYSP